MPRCPTCQSEYAEDISYCPRDGAALLPAVLEGRYRLLSQLGAGGMGVVYLAEHLGLRKSVAVKLLRGELSREPTFARRFEQEAIAASQIGHEHIVNVTDLGRTPTGELFYVMELLEGESLGALLLRERFLPLWRAVPILTQVCRALEAAHARGIVHRDVKPQNVMLLQRQGQADFVKVVDFGISKVLQGQQASGLTEAGAILGTAHYMAPEQASGGTVDARADVYAVGVLTYEVCTGSLPFRGDNTFATMLQHLEATAEPPSRRRPDLGLPPELDALVLGALAKDPAARPTLEAFRAGLEALVPGRVPLQLTPAMATGRVPALPPAAPPAPAAPAVAEPLEPTLVSTRSLEAVHRARRGGLLVGGVGTLLLLGGVGLWAATSRGPAVEPPAVSAPAAAPAPVAAPAPAPATEPPKESAPPPATAREQLPEGERREVPPKKQPPARPRPDKPRPGKVPDKVQDLKPNPF
ncbi:serine/threonine protein kinase [Archangium gephyra]|uniref:non-specific serine/threonine protein kinase n=1 Tax=Archangium gephyra TaxID=48 RepID=A0AAC8Q9M4_9BACT|nr:serine/threonine-protein kinase [Archangium gephyra]AKJ03454.1 serine/threonine protein kinase [Archangium gephyra]REG24039.1 serine/threonine protein kinase [Archangium gephyra]